MCACALHKHDHANGCAVDSSRHKCRKAYETKVGIDALLTTLDGPHLRLLRVVARFRRGRFHGDIIYGCSVSFTSRSRSYYGTFAKSSDTSSQTAKFEFLHFATHFKIAKRHSLQLHAPNLTLVT